MLNTDPQQTRTGDDETVHAIMRSGSLGALVLAALATTILVAIWLAFYFLVFMPRAIMS